MGRPALEPGCPGGEAEDEGDRGEWGERVAFLRRLSWPWGCHARDGQIHVNAEVRAGVHWTMERLLWKAVGLGRRWGRVRAMTC